MITKWYLIFRAFLDRENRYNCVLSQINCIGWFREPYSRTEKTTRKQVAPSSIVTSNAVNDEIEHGRHTTTGVEEDWAVEFWRNIMQVWIEMWVMFLHVKKTLSTPLLRRAEPKMSCFVRLVVERGACLCLRWWCFRMVLCSVQWETSSLVRFHTNTEG